MRIQKRLFPAWIFGISFTLLLGLFRFSADAQTNDTIWIPVTYFDFHSNGTNPEFEAPHIPALRTGMVDDTLDSDSLPQLGPTPYLNYYVKYWFRSWDGEGGAKGDFRVPKYNSSGQFQSFRDTTYDTAFKNMVFQDVLPFVKVPNTIGTYTYLNPAFFPLDKKGFGNEGLKHNFSFTMAIHYPFTKTQSAQIFEFLGDDDVWAFVDGKLVMDIGGIHGHRQGQFVVPDNLPINKPVSFDFFFAERHTDSSYIQITTNIFVHDTPEVKINLNTNSICAGDTNKIGAILLYDDSLRTDLAKEITWQVEKTRSTVNKNSIKGNIKSLQGDTISLSPTDAYDTMVISASFIDTLFTPPKTVTAKCTIAVKACYAVKLWIEEVTFDNDGNPVVKDSLDPAELEVLTIGKTSTQAKAYAVARDANGNFVRLADPNTTVWSSENTSVITTEGESGKKYHGIITRVASNDSALAIVSEPGLESDEVMVHLIEDCIVELRLKDDGGNVVTSISMNTGEKRNYIVEGKKSSSGEWVVIDAQWELESPPNYSIATPGRNSKWTFDPTSPGESELIISRPFDNSCPDIVPILKIPVTVTVEQPSRVEIEVLSDPAIAGDTLKAAVRIYNSDGLVPGSYWFKEDGDENLQVVYYDTLKNPSGSKRPTPKICVNGIWTDLNEGFSESIKHDQRFIDGVDTIKFVSYYAPSTNVDSTHLLHVKIDSDRQDEDEFNLIAADPDSLKITDKNYNPVTELVVVTSGDKNAKVYTTVLYDIYGNKIQESPNCKWQTGGELKPDSIPSSPDYNYIAETTLKLLNGTIIASYIFGTDTIKDQIQIRITDLPAVLQSATTKDDNGNGFLDRIVLKFNKPVNIDNNNTSLFDISFGTDVSFKITNIVPSETDNSTYNLYLEETKTKASKQPYTYEPQTNWKPIVSSDGQSDFNEFSDFKCTDGAAPVVWYVYKEQAEGLDAKDREKDVVTITLSEEFKTSSNQAFSPTDHPDVSFSVWYKDPTGVDKSFQLVPDMLKDIDGFLDIRSTKISFRMINRNNITDNHYININYTTNSLQDASGSNNYPDSNNQRVKVVVHSPWSVMKVLPNPSSVNFEHTNPGVFELKNDPLALYYAKARKGIAININIPMPIEGEKVKGVAKVYDMAGNIVNTSFNNDLVSEQDRANFSGTFDIDLYWNGSNSKGMGVSPGIYRIIIYVSYSKKSTKNLSFQDNIGFEK